MSDKNKIRQLATEEIESQVVIYEETPITKDDILNQLLIEFRNRIYNVLLLGDICQTQEELIRDSGILYEELKDNLNRLEDHLRGSEE